MSAPRYALITGASSGIGRATAQRFAAEGWTVCVNARRKERLDSLVAMFPPGNHLVCPGDYSDPSVVETLREVIAGAWGRLDALVNCAGLYEAADALGSDIGRWRTVLDTLLNGAVLVTRAAVQLMDRGGRVIHVTSIHGERAEKNSSAYAMAKAALNQYVRSLAVELADRGILVNAIAPGFVNTPMSVVNGVNELDTEWFRRNYVEGHHLPLRRAGRPDEIAGVAFFLAGPDATYITGQVITVDGGLTITF